MKKETLIEDIDKIGHRLDGLYKDVKNRNYPTQGIKRYNALAELRGHLRDELNDILEQEQIREATDAFAKNMSNLIWASDMEDDDAF
jgi:hypothetical protein